MAITTVVIPHNLKFAINEMWFVGWGSAPDPAGYKGAAPAD